MLINEFKYLLDHSHVYLKSNDHVGEEFDEYFEETWMERASSFNKVCKRFARLCDKFTFIDNRELFFDINSYMMNLQGKILRNHILSFG